uniref:Uncharacterized protein n=1 Tax=Arundo donax TaxID=35708 RepID=A0A0A8ZHT6_ARUDO
MTLQQHSIKFNRQKLGSTKFARMAGII